MKFIELKLDENKTHYINVSNIIFVHNNMGLAHIYVVQSEEPIKTRLKYDDVVNLIKNTSNF